MCTLNEPEVSSVDDETESAEPLEDLEEYLEDNEGLGRCTENKRSEKTKDWERCTETIEIQKGRER